MSDRIKIINATVDDFALEVYSYLPANGSTGDHEDGRIVKYLTCLYMWHDATGEWVKFANADDLTSLETRLSQQEVGCDTDVTSLEGIDSSLEVRISEEESAMLSAIASEEARASTVEGSLELEISSLIVSREEDVSYETSLQGSLITEVDSTITSLIQARISAVDSLEARASSVETSLETRLSNEEDTKDAADLSLSNRISAEESNMTRGSWSFTLDLMSANVAGLNASDSLELALSTEEGRISAILAASTADKDQFVEIVSHINAVDLLHDTQTSTEIASLAADIISMESSLEGIDTSLETRLSNEEDTMSVGDTSLTTRVSSEEVATAAGDSSLSTRMGINESERLTADNSLTARAGTNELSRTNADISIDTRLSNEEDAMSAGDLSLETLLSGDSADRVSDDSSIATRMSEEESAMLSAVASGEAERIAADTSLEDRISIEAFERFVQDHVQINQDINGQEQVRVWSDDSLTTRLSNEEDNFSTDKSSIETRLSIEEDAMSAGDSSVETRFSNEISTEKSRIDEILDSADADKDTFVELVSFITEFDVDADDQLASYQLVIDSRISDEESNMPAGDLSLETELSSQIIARQSAVTSLENKHSGEISTLASSVDSLETREEARHLRIDFSNKTSFTVLQTDLPSGFTPGNGLVQVYQEVSSNTYRRLVSPMNFDPTTGEMTFDLGVSPKSGFAVFYSFAGDETDMSSSSGQQAAPPPPNSSSSSYPDFVITGATMSHGALQGDSSSVTFNTTGVTAANLDSFLQYSGDTFYLGVGGQRTFNYYDIHQNRYGVSFDWAVDYSSFTISWENVNNALTYSEPAAPSGDAHIASLYFGHGSDRAYFKVAFRFDSVTGALVPSTSSAGEYIDNGNTLYLSPPYMVGSGTATYTANVDQGTYNVRNNVYRYLRGPQWEIPLGNLTEHLVVNQSTSNNVKNYVSQTGSYTSSYGSISYESQNMFFSTFGGAWGITVTSGGTDYYSVGTKLNSSHHLWSEVTTNRTLTNSIDRMSANVDPTNETVAFSYSDGSYSSTANPDADSIVTLYLAAGLGYGMELINDTHLTNTNTTYNWGANTSYATDIKIVIDTSDQSYEIYRNSNVGGSPTWVAVDRAYLSNQEVN